MASVAFDTVAPWARPTAASSYGRRRIRAASRSIADGTGRFVPAPAALAPQPEVVAIGGRAARNQRSCPGAAALQHARLKEPPCRDIDVCRRRFTSSRISPPRPCLPVLPTCSPAARRTPEVAFAIERELERGLDSKDHGARADSVAAPAPPAHEAALYCHSSPMQDVSLIAAQLLDGV